MAETLRSDGADTSEIQDGKLKSFGEKGKSRNIGAPTLETAQGNEADEEGDDNNDDGDDNGDKEEETFSFFHAKHTGKMTDSISVKTDK